jgi:hypothetical protein
MNNGVSDVSYTLLSLNGHSQKQQEANGKKKFRFHLLVSFSTESDSDLGGKLASSDIRAINY